VRRQLPDRGRLLGARKDAEIPGDGVAQAKASLRRQLEDGRAGEHLRHGVHFKPRRGHIRCAAIHIGKAVSLREHDLAVADHEHRSGEPVRSEAGELRVKSLAERANDAIALK
jgi:hypothetical protein